MKTPRHFLFSVVTALPWIFSAPVILAADTIVESAREIPVAYDVDVVIVGGGVGAVTAAVEAASKALGDSGRVLLRPSGTELMVRVMVEAASEADARRIADELADVVRG